MVSRVSHVPYAEGSKKGNGLAPPTGIGRMAVWVVKTCFLIKNNNIKIGGILEAVAGRLKKSLKPYPCKIYQGIILFAGGIIRNHCLDGEKAVQSS